jgi:hypothetical protein
MAGAAKSDRVAMGIFLDRPQREQADRLKTVMGGTRSAVLRAAIDLGLAELERRHPEAASDASGETAA